MTISLVPFTSRNTEAETCACVADADSKENRRRNSQNIISGRIEAVSLNVSQFIYLYYLIIYIQCLIDCFIFFYVYNRHCSCNVLCMCDASKMAMLSLKLDYYTTLLYYNNYYTVIVLLLVHTVTYAFYIPLHVMNIPLWGDKYNLILHMILSQSWTLYSLLLI